MLINELVGLIFNFEENFIAYIEINLFSGLAGSRIGQEVGLKTQMWSLIVMKTTHLPHRYIDSRVHG